jgi:hypothetical protein
VVETPLSKLAEEERRARETAEDKLAVVEQEAVGARRDAEDARARAEASMGAALIYTLAVAISISRLEIFPAEWVSKWSGYLALATPATSALYFAFRSKE